MIVNCHREGNSSALLASASPSARGIRPDGTGSRHIQAVVLVGLASRMDDVVIRFSLVTASRGV